MTSARVRSCASSRSPELSHAILTEILGAAVTGYRDLVTENFACFGWALGLNSGLPVQVKGTLAIPEDDTDGEFTHLHYQLKPATTAGRDAVSDVQLDLLTEPGTGWRGARMVASRYERRQTPFYVPIS